MLQFKEGNANAVIGANKTYTVLLIVLRYPPFPEEEFVIIFIAIVDL